MSKENKPPRERIPGTEEFNAKYPLHKPEKSTSHNQQILIGAIVAKHKEALRIALIALQAKCAKEARIGVYTPQGMLHNTKRRIATDNGAYYEVDRDHILSIDIEEFLK